MKKPIKFLLIAIALATVIYSCTKDSGITENLNPIEEDISINAFNGHPVEGSYIIVFKDNAFPILQSRSGINKENYQLQKVALETQAKNIFRRGGISDKEIKQSYVKTLSGIAIDLTKEEVETLRKDNRIDYIEQNQMGGISMGGPPGSGSDPQVTPWGITRVGGAGDGTGLTAWIIDSGIDFDHPDLNVDVSRSISFGSGGGGANDANGHGSHVAGTVAAIDNNIGVIGVAAGATVVAVRVVNRRGSGTTAECIAGVDYVAANGAAGDAANMSLRYGFSTALNTAVSNAAANGIKFAIASGNDAQDTNNVSPGSVNGANIYTVSAMSQGDNWASFSNFGNPPVDFCAPGVNVYSCYKNGGYATLGGTSMASPHVCGILLLGNVSSDGTVNGDPDGTPDPIAHR